MPEELLCDLLRDKWFQDADHLALRLVSQCVGQGVHNFLCQGGFELSWRLGQACLAIRCRARRASLVRIEVRTQCELKSIRE